MNKASNSNETFAGLPAKLKALVALAVLIDGFDAEDYLSNDQVDSERLTLAAAEILAIPKPDLRLSYTAAYLRDALAELNEAGDL